MAEYKFADGFHPPRGSKADPQVVGETLEALREGNAGALTADLVVDSAAHSESPLHPFFEWDDTQAAEQHRRNQARSVIRSVKIVYRSSPDSEAKTVRAFVSISKEGDRVYTSTFAAMSEADQRIQVIRRAWSDLQSFRKRYGEITEFASLYAALDELETALPPLLGDSIAA